MEEAKDKHYPEEPVPHYPEESLPATLNSSTDSPSGTHTTDIEHQRKETSVEESVVSSIQENKDQSAEWLNISESSANTEIFDDRMVVRNQTSIVESVASVVQENEDQSAGRLNISESIDETELVDNVMVVGMETSVVASIASPVEESKDQSAEQLNISESINDAKIVDDGTVSLNSGPNQLETKTAETSILSNKSENGISISNKDIQKQGFTDDKKIFTYGHLSLAKPSKKVKERKEYRGLVDTAAPFESVKEAVTKFGGIVDWKAHKSQILERRRLIQLELEKVKEEIPLYREQSEAAENAKADILKELEETRRFIEELKLSFEKAQTEESQTKQDLELVQLRVKEIDQGIASEASVAAKAQVDVVKARYTAAAAELKSTKTELKSLQEQHDYLMNERDIAIRKAVAAVNASRDIEKTVEDLTMELITAREALESAHASHMEAEEHRIGAVLARDQDVLNWEKELKQAEGELQVLNEKLLSVKDLQSKLATASTLLLNLKSELAAYMEAKLSQESLDAGGGKAKIYNEVTTTHASIHEAVASVKREIEDVNSNIEKAKEEAKYLNVAVASLQSELETEKAALNNMKQREGMALIAVQSLEAELNRIHKEIEFTQAKEKETKDELVKLPEALHRASWEADEAKLAVQTAFEDLGKVKEEVQQVKASSTTIQSRLNASLKEIEAAQASERIALSAIKALQESEHTTEKGLVDLSAGVQVTIPLDEYYALSKRAYEAEEKANQKVSVAISHIQVAKASELQALEQLAQSHDELALKKEVLRSANEKAEKATQGKLGAEQELRKWRADNERRRKAGTTSQVVIPSSSPRRSLEETKGSKPEWGKAYVTQATPSGITSFSENSVHNIVPEVKPRKKKSFFPRFVRFLVRKKPQTVG